MMLLIKRFGKHNRKNNHKTAKSFKVVIPVTNNLNFTALTKLRNLNNYPIYIQRLQRLAIHEQLMLLIKNDNRVVIELQEWINKSIGRATVEIKTISDDGEEIVLSKGGYIFFQGFGTLRGSISVGRFLS